MERPWVVVPTSWEQYSRSLPSGSESILWSFGEPGANDGATPYYGRLIMDSAGNIFGTTVNGGSNGNGTVFKVNWQVPVLVGD